MLVVTPAIANLIRENKTFRINSAIQTGAKHGMHAARRRAVQALERTGKCTKEDVLAKANNARRTGRADRQRRTRHVRRRRRRRRQGRKTATADTARRSNRARQSTDERNSIAQPLSNASARGVTLHGNAANRTDSGRPRLHHRRSARDAARRAAAAARRAARARSPRAMGLVTDEQLAQALAEQMGHAGRQPGRHRRSRPKCSSWSPRRWPRSTASCPIALPRRHADGRDVRSAEPRRSWTSCGPSWATTSGAVVATERDMLKALDRYYAAGGESVESLVARHGGRRRAGRRRRRRSAKTARST